MNLSLRSVCVQKWFWIERFTMWLTNFWNHVHYSTIYSWLAEFWWTVSTQICHSPLKLSKRPLICPNFALWNLRTGVKIMFWLPFNFFHYRISSAQKTKRRRKRGVVGRHVCPYLVMTSSYYWVTQPFIRSRWLYAWLLTGMTGKQSKRRGEVKWAKWSVCAVQSMFGPS